MTRSEQQGNEQQASPDSVFLDRVKDALNRLYDFPALERHPLAQGLAADTLRRNESPGQALRRALMAAIEACNPGRTLPFRSPRARLYHLLVLHYVEGMTVQEAAHELGISRRQAHRDLVRGEQGIAAMLWAQRANVTQTAPASQQPASVQREIERLEIHTETQDLRLLLEHALEAVRPLAQRRHVSLQSDMSSEAVVLSTDPVMARQVLVNTLSQAIVESAPGIMHLVFSGANEPLLQVSYLAEAMNVAAPADNVVAQLAERLGWRIRRETDGSRHIIALHMASASPHILVIDDSIGFLELVETFLAGQNCRVQTVRNGRDGLRLAQATVPDAILLDVMMPDMDGWEFLQRLHNHPQTAAIPILVCSVITNPDLAYSLGASAVLTKPVSQQDVLAALRQVGVL